MIGELCKIGKDKIIHSVENIFNRLSHVSISNLHDYFISESF